MNCISALILILCVIGRSQSAVVTGDIQTSDQFTFLTKFCFGTSTSAPGKLSMQFETSGKFAPDVGISLYFDDKTTASGWDKVYGNKSLTCEQKVALAGGFKSLLEHNGTFTEPFGDTQRPHFWYVAFVNCRAQPVDYTWTAEWTQPDGSEVSWDQEGSLEMYIAFTLVYLIGSAAHIYGDIILFRNGSLHPIVRVLTISIILELVSLFAFLIHWAIYVGNGIGSPVMNFLGQICDMFAQLVFMLELLFVAKGWAITHQTLTEKKVLLIVLGVFFFAYVTLFFWQFFGINPATSLYVYQSIPGAIILVVRFAAYGYFMFSLIKTFREENDSDKRKFYSIFGGFYSLWFLSLPFVVFLAFLVAPWVRAKTVLSITLIAVTLGQGVLCILLWPSRAAKYFSISAPDLIGYSSANL